MDKKLGVLGGMGPMATVDFVKRIVEKSPACSDQEHMSMIISNDPVIPDRTKHILENGENPLEKMLKNLMNLKNSGATKVVIPCNTAHYWLDKLSHNERVPFISIIDAVMNEASRRQMCRVGVLATNATIQTGIYTNAIEIRGMQAILPTAKEQFQVMEGIYCVKAGQIEQGRRLMEPVFDSLINKGADGVVLGCTEIPLAFDTLPADKMAKALDSLDLLADQCVNYYYYDA
ncbi:amino acid racemase [Vibrio sp. DW001]|uniref:aspartate/glutamate racemase family protein n=1 Tax=Vibrio sp. DW001 TaxID=2912315 RepID=UPI0023AEA13B|nr:amino acid racemase [Vibrio sp. DW001]WED25291.1 amino acid racemase [Vibrio sp. DW001]